MSDGLRYMTRLFVSMFRMSAPRPRTARGTAVLVLLGICAVTYGYVPALAEGDPDAGREYSAQMLRSRLVAMERAFERVGGVYEEEVAPVERVLSRYRSNDPRLVRRISVALVRESKKRGVDPSLMVGVLLVENPMLDPKAKSFVGATGLMQVMPLHQGRWGCGPRLDDVESNICTGSKILASYLRAEKGDLNRALLRYNGCVTGSNTPHCHDYPRYVLARAALVRQQSAQSPADEELVGSK
jgi:soluble lytic murein transglycosylase-like protein